MVNSDKSQVGRTTWANKDNINSLDTVATVAKSIWNL